MKHGLGKLTYADGSVYDGEWKDNEMNGKGKYTCANGSIHEGYFMNNAFAILVPFKDLS